MNRSRIFLALVGLLVSGLFFAACGVFNPAVNESTPFVRLYTQAAATLQSKDLLASPSAPAAILPNTGSTALPPAAPTASPVVSLSITPAAPPALVTPSPAPRCNWAQLLGVNDGAGRLLVVARQKFDVVWRLRNIGSCTWTRAYSLVHYTGNQFGAQVPANLPAVVAPGQVVEIHMRFSAPSGPGLRQGFWMLSDADGILFGSGTGARQPFEVDVMVENPPRESPPAGQPSPTPVPPQGGSTPPAASPYPPSGGYPPPHPTSEPPTGNPSHPAPNPPPVTDPGSGNGQGSGNSQGNGQGSGPGNGKPKDKPKDKPKEKPPKKPKDQGHGKGKGKGK